MERFKSKVVLLSLGVLVLTFILVAVLVVTKTKKPQTTPVLSSKPAQAITQEQALRKIIKASFDTDEEKGILAYFDLGLAEKSPEQSYLYLKKAFNKMSISYQSLKSPEKKLALSKLRAYVSTLPNYKETDFIVPK